MEQYFSIGEASKYAGIPISTLRYYDSIKLLSPSYRDENTNYRYYSLLEAETLKFISHMRHLGFSIESIKSHLKNMDYEHTLKLFDKILLETNLEIARLHTIEQEIIESRNKLKKKYDLLQKKDIPFIQNSDDVIGIVYNEVTNNENEMNKLIKKLDSLKINDSGTILNGCTVSIENWKKNHHRKDTYITKIKNENNNNQIIIPKGKYACMYAQGSFENDNYVETLLTWIDNNNFKVIGDIILTFDDFFMLKEDRDLFFLIRIQVK